MSVATPLRSIVEATRHDRAPAPYVPQYGVDDDTGDQSLVVVPWSNWGKHRLYVNTADGAQVGWVDLDTGERSLVMLELAFEFEAAIQSHDEEEQYQPRRGVVTSAQNSRSTGAYTVHRFGSIPGTRSYAGSEPEAHHEPTVAEELDDLVALDPRWACIGAIPVGAHGSVIDHLVVGPGGVFTINEWHHNVPDSRHEAERAGKLLSATANAAITARGLIVPVGVAELTVKEQPVDVQVVEASALVDFLIGQPEALDAYTIALVMTCARLSSTWRPASTSD